MSDNQRIVVMMLAAGGVLEALFLLGQFWGEWDMVTGMVTMAPYYLIAPVAAVMPFAWLMSWHRNAPSMSNLVLVGVSTIFVMRFFVAPEVVLFLPFVAIFVAALGQMMSRSWEVATALTVGALLASVMVTDSVEPDMMVAAVPVMFVMVATTAGLLMAAGVVAAMAVWIPGRQIAAIFRWRWPVKFAELVRAGYGAVVVTIPVVIAAAALGELLAPWWPWQATLGTPLVLVTAFVLWRGAELSAR